MQNNIFLIVFFVFLMFAHAASASTCGYLFTRNKEINQERDAMLTELENIRFSTKILGFQFTDAPALKLSKYFAKYSTIKDTPIELMLFTEIKRHVFSKDYLPLPVEQVLHDVELGLSLSVNDETISYQLKRKGVVVSPAMYYKNRQAFIKQLSRYKDLNYYSGFGRFFRKKYLAFLFRFHPDLQKSTYRVRELVAEEFLSLNNFKKLEEIIRLYQD